MKKVLISGGSGLVGNTLTRLLKNEGIEVHWLSTRKNANAQGVQVHYWNPNALEIEDGALDGIDTVFHLAGASVAQRWTDKNKRAILDSRVMGTQTLYKAIAESDHKPENFISASAVGYYPSDYDEFYTEDAAPATDFLGNVVTEWEREVDRISSLGARVVKLRIGIVLDKSGGALGQMIPAFKFGLGSPLGSGKQWMPWIHVEDLARMFIHAGNNAKMTGAYNAAAESQVRNKEFGRCLAVAMNKPYFFPPVPSFALKLLLGEMAQIALMSTHVSVERVKETGFTWKHPELVSAMKDVLSK
ncbi:MAG: TIGR01777 family protein [Flavobacteriia bacterium]|nr:TIGR01777 family protein [Flavobacteriia bacterium]